MATPTLPQDARRPDRRAEKLAKNRAKYTYDYSYPEGIATASEVPRSDTFDARYIVDIVELMLKIVENHANIEFEGFEKDVSEHEKSLKNLIKNVVHGELKENFFGTVNRMKEKVLLAHFSKPADYLSLFATIPKTPICEYADAPSSDQDLVFAWQRIAGANPMMINGATRLPDHFPVTEAHFSAATGGGDSLAAALAEGRTFVADYAKLDGAPGGISYGYQKYVYAPMALFAWTGGKFLPIAIQCGQKPGPAFPIFTPRDGWHWTMARSVVMAADGTTHEACEHLGKTHLIMEAVVMAAERQLSEDHPLKVLLDRHGTFTLDINDSAKTDLIAPNGAVDHVVGPTIEATVGLVKATVSGVSFWNLAPPRELAARGVDVASLPHYPYRDDLLLIWTAITDFVEAYVRLYYDSDAAVSADPELQAFVNELGSNDGGRISGVPEVKDIDTLVQVLAIAIHLASSQHAAVNFSQFPYMSLGTNMPGAMFAPAPTLESEASEAAWMAMLPPPKIMSETFNTVYQLSNVRNNWLGVFDHHRMIPILPSKHDFDDKNAREVADDFTKALEAIEAVIGDRNNKRVIPYEFLIPSLIPASIHI